MTTATSKQAELNSAIKRVGQRIKRWSATTALIVAFHLPTPPVPASRPRISKWGTYYTKTYNGFRGKAPADLQAAIDAGNIEPAPKGLPLVLLIEVVTVKPKTGKRDYPNGDVDNYAKALLDIGNPDEKKGRRGLWHDDDQIVALTVTKRYADPGEEAGTHYHLLPLNALS